MSSERPVVRRVLLIVSTLDGSGPGMVMSVLARRLKRRGVDVVLLSTHGPHDSSLIADTRAAGVRVSNLGMRSMWDPSGMAKLTSFMREWRPEVVHTRTIRADLLGRLAAAHCVPVINNVVNMYPDDCLVRLGPLAGRAVMAVARRTKGAVRFFAANAQAVATNTIAAFGAPPQRVGVVYDGLELDRWSEAPPADLRSHGVGLEDTVCLAVARLHPQKGLEDLVAAAEKVVAERAEVRFVVAGEGPQRAALATQIDAAGLGGNVILLGNRKDVPRLMARADLFVLPSRFEGLPSAIIEAMAAGLPVVATATAGTPELVRDGHTGWLVPPSAPHELAQTLLEALGDDGLEDIGLRGQSRAHELFSAEHMTARFAELYETVSNG